jgi:hypothetical protein
MDFPWITRFVAPRRFQHGTAETEKNQEVPHAKSAKLAKLKDQISFAAGLRELCVLGVLGARKSCVSTYYDYK